MSDLRSRITAALREALLSEIGGSIDGVDNIYVGDETVHLVILADAVIRELGLPPHWGRPSFDNGDTCELTDSDPAHRPTESAS